MELGYNLLPVDILRAVFRLVPLRSLCRLSLGSSRHSKEVWSLLTELDAFQVRDPASASLCWPLNVAHLGSLLPRACGSLRTLNLYIGESTDARNKYFNGKRQVDVVAAPFGALAPALVASSSNLQHLAIKETAWNTSGKSNIYKTIDLLPNLKANLSSLSIDSMALIPSHVAAGFFDMPSLTSLSLRSTVATPEAWRHLSQLSKLISLSLDHCIGQSSSFFLHLEGLTRLQELRLAFSHLADHYNVTSDAQIWALAVGIFGSDDPTEPDIPTAFLTALTKLTSLSLHVPEKAMRAILEQIQSQDWAINSLTRLELMPLTTVDLELNWLLGVTALTQLKEIKTSDLPTRLLCYSPQLTSLVVKNDPEEGDSLVLPSLVHMQKIRLELWNFYGITADSLRSSLLPMAATLQHLHLQFGDGFSDDEISVLQSLTQLTYLSLSGSLITNEGVCSISTLTNLHVLKLASSFQLTGIPVANLTKLHEISLDSCAALTSLAGVVCLPNLSSLTLSTCRALFGSQVRQLSSITNLTKLDLRGVMDVSREDILWLTTLTSLEWLLVNSSDKLNHHDYEQLRVSLPNLESRIIPETKHNVM